ncbi:hypothetical protein [Flavobacterium sp. PL02]|jgi:hypothetical protein|uniref:hypothetical protein n=1 Tax=Flavobacterium sp. PL02 TaxID=3088354 RepID=UPI00057D5F59|nr:hypothetical protein [Flavobacterium sp. PL02]KIC03523.1 hypothetical protein OA88_03900 [Flavobacterium sp. JRM]MEA9413250.1 hypothetical protein [Flavobacterium sp. PL02]
MDLYIFEEEVNEFIKKDNLDKAIEITESELKKLPSNSFQIVLNRNLLHLKARLNEYLNEFYKESKSDIEEIDKTIKAIYCEMNGFTINYDLWFLSGFGFSFCNDLEDLDWLGDYDSYTENLFEITGFEDLQNVYKDYMQNEKWEDENLEIASELCAILITLRLEELFRETYKESTRNNDLWSEIPVFVTSHDSELVYRTQ